MRRGAGASRPVRQPRLEPRRGLLGEPIATPQKIPGLVVRPLLASDLDAADRVFRLAFGTFLGLPDPTQFHGDADFVRSRWKSDPAATFGAELDGELVASNFAANWGSVGFFGPLTVRPDLWDRGIARQLLGPTMQLFDQWGVKHRGLFTFAQSPKHIALYQKYGFWPRFLTAVMSRQIPDGARMAEWSRFSQAALEDREACLRACRELTCSLYDGLDLEREISAVADLRLGDTALLWDGSKLVGVAVCHCGAGTEAGSGTCYVKFGAVRPGPKAAQDFERLLDACDALGAALGATRVLAGANMGRLEAYRRMLARGFRTEFLGVAMETGSGDSGYNRRNVYILDDWR